MKITIQLAKILHFWQMSSSHNQNKSWIFFKENKVFPKVESNFSSIGKEMGISLSEISWKGAGKKKKKKAIFYSKYKYKESNFRKTV